MPAVIVCIQRYAGDTASDIDSPGRCAAAAHLTQSAAQQTSGTVHSCFVVRLESQIEIKKIPSMARHFLMERSIA